MQSDSKGIRFPWERKTADMSDIRMRQICLVAHDLERVQGQFEAVFGVAVCYRDPGVGRYGLHTC